MNDEILQKGLDTCTFCPKLCYHACPVAKETSKEAHTPWGLVTLANLAHKRMIPFSGELAANLYQCLDCLGCWSACDLNNNVPELLHPFRARAFEEDLAPIPLYSFSHHFREKNNPYGLDLAATVAELTKGMKVDGSKTAVYLAGCTTLSKSPQSVRAWISLHEKLNIPCPPVFQEPVQCCGYPLYAAGDMAQFKDVAEMQYQSFRDAQQIISPLPECLYTMEKLYPKVGVRLKARKLHVTSYFAELLKQTRFISAEPREPVLYQDSCMLGRYLGNYETPRDLLIQRLGVQLKEFSLHHDQGTCCGAMLPFAALEPQTSQAIATDRMAEAPSRALQLVVTPSPQCAAHLKKGDATTRVMDFVDYLDSLIEPIR